LRPARREKNNGPDGLPLYLPSYYVVYNGWN
jgi:hypothetical protein